MSTAIGLQQIESTNFGDFVSLDHLTPGAEEKQLYQAYRRYMVGHETPIRSMARMMMQANVGRGKLRKSDQPPVIIFTFGTTGSGKTLWAESTAKILFDDPKGMIKLSGGSFQLPHQITTLTGAPPSYVGHDKDGYITQEKLDYPGYMAQVKDPIARKYYFVLDKLELLHAERSIISSYENSLQNAFMGRAAIDMSSYQKAIAQRPRVDKLINRYTGLRDKLQELYPYLGNMAREPYDPDNGYPSLMLIDEFEKADDALRKFLLEILDKAEFHPQGQNAGPVSFRNTIIMLTSNIAQDKMLQLTDGRTLGFRHDQPKSEEEYMEECEKIRQEVLDIGFDAIAQQFSPEFIGRIGQENIFALGPLTPGEQAERLDRISIPDYQEQLYKLFGISLQITNEARRYLVSEAYKRRSVILGARALNAAFKLHINGGIASLLAKTPDEGGIIPGDELIADLQKKNGQPTVHFGLRRTPGRFEEVSKWLKEARELEIDIYNNGGMAVFEPFAI